MCTINKHLLSLYENIVTAQPELHETFLCHHYQYSINYRINNMLVFLQFYNSAVNKLHYHTVRPSLL